MHFIIDSIKKHSDENPDKKALIFKETSITYKSLYSNICNAAGILRDKGIKKGSNILLITSTCIETIIMYFAIQECGAVVVLADKNIKTDNIIDTYKDYDCSLVVSKNKISISEIIQASFFELLNDDTNDNRKLLVTHKPNDIAEIIFTSGTTSKAKGVMLSYKALSTMLDNTSEGVRLSEDPILFAPLPIHHMFFMSKLRRLMFAGGTIVLQDGMSFGIITENNIKNNKCNELALVPTYYDIMKNQMKDRLPEILSNIKRVDFSSGMLSVRQRKELSKLLPNAQIISIWGTSETGGILFIDINEVSCDDTKIATIGKNYSNTLVKIVGNDGNEVIGDSTSPGKISIKTDAIMSGYWKNIELTNKTIVDGWITINDIVYKDKDGYFYLLGRSDDIINVGGEKVSPVEVENAMELSGLVRECACIGVDDKNGILGQIPVAFICTNDDYDEIKLKDYLSKRLEKYKVPKRFIVVNELPRNNLKKIDRNELRKIIK